MEKLSCDVAVKIEWSGWSLCESSFSLLLVPHRPGVFALAEEVIATPGLGDSASASSRMLALFSVAEAEDLGCSLGALFASSSPWRERLERSRCYVRYAVIPDKVERHAVRFALEAWMNAGAERASGIVRSPSPALRPDEVYADCDPADCTRSLAVAAAGGGKSAVSVPLPASREANRNQRMARPVFPAGF
jgi:hypothetical protein